MQKRKYRLHIYIHFICVLEKQHYNENTSSGTTYTWVLEFGDPSSFSLVCSFFFHFVFSSLVFVIFLRSSNNNLVHSRLIIYYNLQFFWEERGCHGTEDNSFPLSKRNILCKQMIIIKQLWIWSMLGRTYGTCKEEERPVKKRIQNAVK